MRALPFLIALLFVTSPAQAYDLKGKAAEFAQELKAKLAETEDRLTQDSRAFVDDLKRQWREQEQKIDEKTKSADDWKAAKRDAQKEKRALNQDFRQRARVQGEELELEIGRFAKEREQEAAKLFAEMQAEVEQFKKTKGYNDAKRDLGEAKRDISALIAKWRTKLRDLKAKQLKFE